MTWTDEKNARRCDLIDMVVDSALSIPEKAELDLLQAEMLEYRRSVAPLPLEELRKLHRSLKRKEREHEQRKEV